MRLRPLRKLKGWNEILTACPICGKSGWCAINDDQNIVRCMRTPADEFVDSSIGRAYVHYLDPESIPQSDVEIVHADSVPKKDNTHLDMVYRTLIEEATLTDEHMYHLRHVRNFSDQEIERRQYRSMGGGDRYKVTKRILNRLEDKGALLGVPGFFTKQGNGGSYWTMAGADGLLIPFRSIINEIIGGKSV